MAATAPSPTGVVSTGLGLTPTLDLETDEEKKKRLAALQAANSRSKGIVSNAMYGTSPGGVGGY